MTEHLLPHSSAVETRRQRLRMWIDQHCEGSQAVFIASTNDGKNQVNQGELSGLLRTKSFGEKRARTLEQQARMPPGYLDSPIENTTSKAGYQVAQAQKPYVVRALPAKIDWPFPTVPLTRIDSLRKALGARDGTLALRDLDALLDVAVAKWERIAATKKNAG